MSTQAVPTGARRAMLAAALCADWPERDRLGWRALTVWPEWALPGAAPNSDKLALRSGAARDAMRLRACIDGSLLQAAATLLGDAVLNELLRDAPATQSGSGALPPVDRLGAVWRESGQAILLGEIDDENLRAAVAAHLGWPLPGSKA